MQHNCQNCNKPISGNFCDYCGQSSSTHRINSHFLLHDIQHGLLHVDKGFFYTAKELFSRPGHTIREFLEGKRVNHFKPISLVLILAGIYGFLSHYFHINMLSNNIQVSGSGENFDRIREAVNKMSEWLSQHYSIFALFQIPIFSIGTYISFKKAGYNFIEHLVINTFLTAQRLILHIVTFPLYYLFNESPSLRITARIVDLVGYALIFISLYQLFSHFNKTKRVFNVLLSLCIAFIILFVILWVTSRIVINSVN